MWNMHVHFTRVLSQAFLSSVETYLGPEHRAASDGLPFRVNVATSEWKLPTAYPLTFGQGHTGVAG